MVSRAPGKVKSKTKPRPLDPMTCPAHVFPPVLQRHVHLVRVRLVVSLMVHAQRGRIQKRLQTIIRVWQLWKGVLLHRLYYQLVGVPLCPCYSDVRTQHCDDRRSHHSTCGIGLRQCPEEVNQPRPFSAHRCEFVNNDALLGERYSTLWSCVDLIDGRGKAHAAYPFSCAAPHSEERGCQEGTGPEHGG